MTLPRWPSFLFLAVLLVAAWALRAPFLDRELWNLDEGSTFTMAQQILEGGVIYRDAVDQRAPLVPYLKAAIFAVAGDWNIFAVHLTLALSLGLAAFLLFDLVRRLGDTFAGIVSAIVFTVLAFGMPGPTDSFAAHTEWYLLLFSILGFWLFSRTHAQGGFNAGFVIGLPFGAAILCKQPGLFDFIVLWVLIALLAFNNPASRARLVRLWLGACTGALLLFALSVAYFAFHGALNDFIYYAWVYNLEYYVPEVSRAERLGGIYLTFRVLFEYTPALGAFAMAGVLFLLIDRFRSTLRPNAPLNLLPWLILGWFVSGLAATMLSGRHYEHYAIQSIPGVSLAAGWISARFISWARSEKRPALRRVSSIVAFLALVALTVWTGSDVHKFRAKVDPNDSSNWPLLRGVIERHSSPSDPILVWGYYPDGYLASRRLPSTRFIYPNFLTGLIPWTNLQPGRDTRYAIVPGAWDDFWADYTARPPAVIIDVDIRGYGKYPLLAQSRLRDEVIDHFAIVERTDTASYWTRVLRRLEPAPPISSAADAPLDASIQLEARMLENTPDAVALAVKSPRPANAVTLRLGDRAYRRIALSGSGPTEVEFFVRVSDLSTHSGGTADVLIEEAGSIHRGAPLDLVAQLSLSPQPQDPVPALVFSGDRLPAETDSSTPWRPEPRSNFPGWQTSDSFTLAFPRPAEMTAVTLEWQPPAPRFPAPDNATLLPSFTLTTPDGSTLDLPVTAVAAELGRHTLTVELPANTPGRLLVRWSRPASIHFATSEAWIGVLHGRDEALTTQRIQTSRNTLALHAPPPFTANPLPFSAR